MDRARSARVECDYLCLGFVNTTGIQGVRVLPFILYVSFVFLYQVTKLISP